VLSHRRNGSTTQVHIGRDVYLRYADSTLVVYEVRTSVEIAAGPAEQTVEVHPERRYCDHPLGTDPAGQGDAIQVFEDGGHYGGYAEIEHHSPAARYGSSVLDVCRTAISLGY
jgi:hypothetical protein